MLLLSLTLFRVRSQSSRQCIQYFKEGLGQTPLDVSRCLALAPVFSSVTLTEDHFPFEVTPGKAQDLTRVLERESQCPQSLRPVLWLLPACVIVCLAANPAPIRFPDSHLCEHDESNEERDDGHNKDEDLPPVLLTEHPGVHVHQRCHQAFYTHKLDERVRESGGKRAPSASPVSQLQLPISQQPPSPAPKSSYPCIWV